MAVHCDICDVHIVSESSLPEHINGRRHQVMLAALRQRLRARRSIFVRGFFFGTTADDLGKVFSAFGNISQVIVNQIHGSFAIIEYDSETSAQKALSHDRDILLRGRRLVVKPRTVKQPVVPPSVEHTDDGDGREENASTQLHNELINKLSSCVTVTVEEQFEALVCELELCASDYTLRTKICQQLEAVLQPTFDGCSVLQFGSSANNLGIQGCDMDLFLSIVDEDTEASMVKQKAAELVKQIAGILRHSPGFVKVLPLPHARCPVVKFVHMPSAIKCDMSVNNRLAQRNTELFRFLTSFDVRIRRLLYAIRYWAKLRRVSGAGVHLTNYALTLLAVFYLQSVSDPLIPSVDRMAQLAEKKCVIDGWDSSFTTDVSLLQHNNSMSTAELFAGFFQFYAQFDFRASVVCPHLGHTVDVSAFIDKQLSDPSLKNFKVTVMSVQDPFVLDHNTTSNVKGRSLVDITHEFQRASDQCCAMIGCEGKIDTEHRGIVELLSDSESSVGTPAASPVMSSLQQVTGHVTDEPGHLQLFVLKQMTSAKVSDAALKPRTDEQCPSDTWCHSVVDVVKQVIVDVLDMDCVVRDGPSDQFNEQLQLLLTEREGRRPAGLSMLVINAARDTGIVRQCEGEDCTEGSSRSHARRDCLVSDSQQCALGKHAQSADDEAAGNGSDELAAKRHKPSNVELDTSAACCSVRMSEQAVDVTGCKQILLSATCSAETRLWVGRKKVRHQLLHISDELKRQLQATALLRTKMKKSDCTLLKFELAVVRSRSETELFVAMLPSKDTSKEFGCFISFFIPLLPKLIKSLSAAEGPFTC